MSEMLMKGLSSTKRELEAGVADAEAELARTEEYCRKLEDLIAVGKATLHAASQMPLPQLSQSTNSMALVPDTDIAKERKAPTARADASPPDQGRSLRDPGPRGRVVRDSVAARGRNHRGRGRGRPAPPALPGAPRDPGPRARP